MDVTEDYAQAEALTCWLGLAFSYSEETMVTHEGSWRLIPEFIDSAQNHCQSRMLDGSSHCKGRHSLFSSPG